MALQTHRPIHPLLLDLQINCHVIETGKMLQAEFTSPVPQMGHVNLELRRDC
jgi:hypothetical protein